MKKLLVSILSMLMVFTLASPISATANGWTTNDANKTPVEASGNYGKRVFGTSAGGYVQMYTDELITSEAKTYEIVVDLTSQTDHGNLVQTSLGLGSGNDTYTTELNVQTTRDGNTFKIEANASNNPAITNIAPSIYTYRWSVSSSEFKFDLLDYKGDTVGTLTYNQDEGFNNSTNIRYLWVFGREINGENYLDKDLITYESIPAIAKVESFIVDESNKPEGIDMSETGYTYVGVKTVVADEWKSVLDNNPYAVMVMGYGEGLVGVDGVTAQYYETLNNKGWTDLNVGYFGPINTGFPLTDGATSYFRLKFTKSGTYEFNMGVAPFVQGAEGGIGDKMEESFVPSSASLDVVVPENGGDPIVEPTPDPVTPPTTEPSRPSYNRPSKPAEDKDLPSNTEECQKEFGKDVVYSEKLGACVYKFMVVDTSAR